MARRNGTNTKRRPSVPPLNRLGSIQAHHALMTQARKRKIDFKGYPTGVFQNRAQLFLYVDVGVGRMKPRIVRTVEPLNAWNYLPHPPLEITIHPTRRRSCRTISR